MNILVIGNGFDLAHGLPTKYTDFLEWIKKYKEFYSYATRKRSAKYCETEDSILRYFNNLFYCSEMDYICDEIYNLVKDNVWIDYFLNTFLSNKENWIDFESEICHVIQSLDSDIHGLSGGSSMDDDVEYLSNMFLNERYSEYIHVVQPTNYNERITYKKIRDQLYKDLNRLIRAFEIYLAEYVEKIQICKISPDIESLKIDHIISFNYTTIFPKLYKLTKKIGETDTESFDYIHGKADINNTIDTNNMVLGIDEYLGKKRRNKNIEFIAFKKYYQRIYKGTGCKYKDWIDEIREDRKEIERREGKEISTQIPFKQCIGKHHLLYIFGHSLDVTDKDILKDLILNDNVKTTIFYHDKETLGQQIANLVKVIGQDELIRRTGGSTRTIGFKLQQPMQSIKE